MRADLSDRNFIADHPDVITASRLDPVLGEALIPFDQSPDFRPLAAALTEAQALTPFVAPPDETAEHTDTPGQPRLLNRRGRRQRSRLGFVRETDHCRPLNRNDRARLLFIAEALELRSKTKGKKNGALGYIGLRVLRTLLLTYANLKTGLCCPSFSTLMQACKLCRQSIADALHRLEATDMLTITRRLVRERITRRSPVTGLMETFTQTVQGSNLYAFNVPAPNALIPLPWRTSRRRPKISNTTPESTTPTENKQRYQPTKQTCLKLNHALDRLARNIACKRLPMTEIAD